MASSPPHATPSEPTPLDRLQRAVAGWVGPVVYALPILEVWLLSRMGDDGANALLVVLQVGWALCFGVVLLICGRRWRAPGPPEGTLVAAAEAELAGGPDDAGRRPAAPSRPASRPRPVAGSDGAHKAAPPAASPRRTAARPKPRRRGEH